jgi:hypothetical protein
MRYQQNLADRKSPLLCSVSSNGRTFGLKSSTLLMPARSHARSFAELDILIADGEGPNTRVARFTRHGRFVQWWGGKGTGPGQFDVPHSIAVDSRGRIYVADRSNNRIQIFDPAGRFLNQWTNFGTPWGLFIKDDRIYVVDGTANNCLLIATLKDGRILEKIEGLNNATAVMVDSRGAIYVGEVNGINVKKLVRQ